MDVPRFSRIARSYLLHIGNLDWTKINPDIFGSMIQAVAEDEERGALGMHYTSVPNILKVLNPLFLDDLRAKLAEAGDNPRTLAQPSQPHGENPRIRSGLRLRQFSRHRLQGNACDRSRDQQAARRTRPAIRDSADEFSRHRTCAIFRPKLRALRSSSPSSNVTCSIEGRKQALAEFLPLDRRELDHLRQRAAA